MAEIENNNAMLEALDSIKQVNVGDVVKGKVLQIDDDRQAIVGLKMPVLKGLFLPTNCPRSQLMTLTMSLR